VLGIRVESLRREISQLFSKVTHTTGKFVRLVTRAGRRVITDPGESFLICRMAVWVLFLSILVKVQPLPRALSMVAPRKRVAESNAPGETEKAMARAIDLLLGTDLLIFRPICWKRAAILHRYLALSGISTQIVFGVRKGTDGEVDGHAWLEANGKPLLESTSPNYNVTYIFPSKDPFNLELALLRRDAPRRPAASR